MPNSQIGPIPWFNAKTQERNLNCFFYNKCLTKASDARWHSFTCKFCPLRSLYQGAPHEVDPDLLLTNPSGYNPCEPLAPPKKEKGNPL